MSATAAGLFLLAAVAAPSLRPPPAAIDLSRSERGVRFDGFSAESAEGRSSTTGRSRLVLDRPLPREFTLRLTGRVIAAANGVDMIVSVRGGDSRRVRFQKDETTHEARLANPWHASTVEWTFVDASTRHDFVFSRVEVLP